MTNATYTPTTFIYIPGDVVMINVDLLRLTPIMLLLFKPHPLEDYSEKFSL